MTRLVKARRTLIAAAIACLLPVGVAAASPESRAQPAKPHIAVVNGHKVTVEEYERAFAAVARQKFYHRTPPQGQVEQARREVAESLVERALILEEADRRGIAIDDAAIRQVLNGYESRYGAAPDWKAVRERALPQIERELGQQQRLAKVEALVRDLPAPAEAEVRAFYDANPALFTEPERIHVSVILLKVDPSAPKLVRDQAREEGRELRERLVKGVDFAEVARIRSSDASATKGGDLGYLHRGMLAEAVHKEIDGLAPGEISPSFDVLEGVTLFKLHERSSATLRDFESVKARAQDLLGRERADRGWKEFVAALRRAAVIETVAPLYPAPATTDGARGKESTWAATEKSRGP